MKFRLTTRTQENMGNACALQDRLLTLFIALGTNPMRWLSRYVLWLQRINDNPLDKFSKRVFRAFNFPVLIGFEFLFRTERSYVEWIVRFVWFHAMRSRADLFPAEPKIEAFLDDLGV